MFTHLTHHVNGQTIRAAHAGPDDAPVLLMLHGFPEYWTAWSDVAAHLTGAFHCVLPDQRGCGASSKPPHVEDYETKRLVADMAALIDEVSPGRPIMLAGHDWGASVAYALAFRHADRIARLVIANGVHPMCFQRALFEDEAQARASQYIHVLRDPASDTRMAEDGFSRTFRMFEKFSTAPWLDETRREAFRDVWEEALPTMLHWYRATPMVVPEEKDGRIAPRAFPFSDDMLSRFRVTMPHLVVWGERDTALLPSCLEGLDRFCENVRIETLPDASHWLLHERPDVVAEHIREFLI